MKVKLIRFKPGARVPERAHYNDAGADVYLPEDIRIKSGETVAINLGFGVAIPDGYFGLIYVRSSMAKHGLDVKLPPIDSGYRGPIQAIIHNSTNWPVELRKDERIGQLVIQPVVIADYVFDLGDERGTGAFGSTGT